MADPDGWPRWLARGLSALQGHSLMFNNCMLHRSGLNTGQVRLAFMYVPPEVRTPAHAKHLGRCVEFEARVAHRSFLAPDCASGQLIVVRFVGHAVVEAFAGPPAEVPHAQVISSQSQGRHGRPTTDAAPPCHPPPTAPRSSIWDPRADGHPGSAIAVAVFSWRSGAAAWAGGGGGRGRRGELGDASAPPRPPPDGTRHGVVRNTTTFQQRVYVLHPQVSVVCVFVVLGTWFGRPWSAMAGH